MNFVVEAQLHVGLSWNRIYKPVSIYNEPQILYTKEKFQKVPETSDHGVGLISQQTSPEAEQPQVRMRDSSPLASAECEK